MEHSEDVGGAGARHGGVQTRQAAVAVYLDGHISEEDAVRVSRHLDACRRCGLAAETFRQIKAGLSRLAGEPDREAVARLERFVEDFPDRET